MKRWHEEYSRIYREWRKHYEAIHAHEPDSNSAARHKRQKGRFRKRKAWDCGNPQCHLCHSDKFPKREKTYQEWASELKLKEE